MALKRIIPVTKNDDQKKTGEREYLDRFFGLLDEKPAGRLIPAESPDFILKTGRKKSIGIELTWLIPEAGKNDKHLSRELIAGCIARKDSKLDLYRKKLIDRFWLLILLGKDGDRHPALHQNTGNWGFETRFHKVFLFLTTENSLLEIK
jgi:hypothetical protein